MILKLTIVIKKSKFTNYNGFIEGEKTMIENKL